jgi:hypothetical protein
MVPGTAPQENCEPDAWSSAAGGLDGLAGAGPRGAVGDAR